MKVSELIAELSGQMARSGDLDVVVSDMGYGDGDDNEIDIEDVVRIGDGPILIRIDD